MAEIVHIEWFVSRNIEIHGKLKYNLSSVKITTDRVQRYVQRCITSRQNGDSMLGCNLRRQNVQERLLGGAHV